MECLRNVLALAAPLERAYRLALVVQDAPLSDPGAGRLAASELVDMHNEARVVLLIASRPRPPS